MTTELTVLLLSALLLLLQLGWMALRANLEAGSGYFLSPRDGKPPLDKLSTGTLRLQRAYGNHREALLPFAIAALAAALSDGSGPVTAACAWIYLAARIVYVPAYLLGWVPWRSVVYGLGYLATFVMILAALF